MSNSNYSDVIELMKKIRVSDAFMKLPEPYIVTFDMFFNLAIKALEAYDKILPLLNPDIDAELALEKIREVIYD